VTDASDRQSPEPAFPDIESLIPHRASMRLVQAVVERGDGTICCSGLVPMDNPTAAEGRAPTIMALELAAQSAAVLEALQRRDAAMRSENNDDGPRIGYLVSLRNARLHQPTVPAGETLHATVHHAGGAAALARYEAKVTSKDGEVLYAEAVLGTYALPPGSEG
jgi:predicted hotdog family 3-hydroxylacyl-ACP dehydratase